jgi:acetylglutamate kinase
VTPRPLTVLKLGGELIEDAAELQSTTARVARLASSGSLVIVHGGGRAIDRELADRGMPKRSVAGLRITDEATLDVVLAVLAGQVNTRLVAALAAAGVSSVGLTGADGPIALVEPASPARTPDGQETALGLVGTPVAASRTALASDLSRLGYVPVVASVGMDPSGRLYNVNADTLAAHLAVALGAARLVVAGGTPGVLDRDGRRFDTLVETDIDALVADGRATAGMVAKLRACRDAVRGGVAEVVIIDGRDGPSYESARGTRIGVPAPVAGGHS